MSKALAAVVSVGAAPHGRLTVAGRVTVRLPVPSWYSSSCKLHGQSGAVNVNVQLPVNVDFWIFPVHQSIVSDVPLLPLSVNVCW